MASPAIRRKPGPIDRRKSGQGSLKQKKVADDLDKLGKRIEVLDPTASECKDFSDLPLSQSTSAGLEASHFKTLTDIQAKAIPHALKGRDILGAAKTGSGKTLAFLIPVLENLYRQKWTELDGLGALIISPTRELAIQIFEVLRKIGRYHTFSAGLVIGGKNVQEERERLGRMNILVCTPGRMLQHMDQTAAFEVDNLQMLVLDEADRIMDMGFQSSVDAILEHLPKTRQTLLFSATQTKRVSDLARLSLQNPEYISVHEAASTATPSTLKQNYIVTPLPEKLDILFSFIRANVKSKILVFLSSGKQVRFVYESFRHLQPGIPLLHLHGRQKQSARLDITSKFASSKNSCLFATDVVARGLDFPAVDWVIQVDCPEDADTYIHRVGRTARYERDGRAVLFLDSTEEEGMLKRLEHKKVPIEKLNVRQKKQQSIKNQLQNMCFQDPELKYLGQRAFVSYTKSIFLQKDKEIFKLQEVDLEGFAASMGLPGAPKIKFQKGDDAKKIKNAPHGALNLSDDESDDPKNKNRKKGEIRTKYDRLFERQNTGVLSDHYTKMLADEVSDDADGEGEADEEDFLSVRRVIPANNMSEADVKDSTVKVVTGIGNEPLVIDSKRREKLLKSKKQLLRFKEKGTKLVYDEEGTAHEIYELEHEDDFHARGPVEAQRAKFLEGEASKVQLADLQDKQLAKEKRKEKKLKRKLREAGASDAIDDEEVPTLVETRVDEDPLALLRSLPLGVEDEDEPPQKKPKKWFQNDNSDLEESSRRKSRLIQVAEEPETLEDLEALASGFLS